MASTPNPTPGDSAEYPSEAQPDDTQPAPTAGQAFLAAAVFLTRLPVPLSRPFDRALFGRAMGWFPAVGALLGVAAGVIFGLLHWLGLPTPLDAVLTVAALIILTGGLHEDGLADTADGFGGGRDREHKLGIMRDSRIGSYGALALILSVAVRIAVVAALPSVWVAIKVLAVAGALSRAAMVAASHWLPPARTDGLSATLGGPTQGATLLALGLAAALAILLLPGGKALVVVALAGAGTLAALRVARAQIGGQTGDVLGAIQQLIEGLVLITLVALT